jgi:hypothetical protein
MANFINSFFLILPLQSYKIAYKRIAELRELYFQQPIDPPKPALPRLLILSYRITDFSGRGWVFSRASFLARPKGLKPSIFGSTVQNMGL